MVVLTDKFDNYNLSNANFCNFFDSIPQILRVNASINIIEMVILDNTYIAHFWRAYLSLLGASSSIP